MQVLDYGGNRRMTDQTYAGIDSGEQIKVYPSINHKGIVVSQSQKEGELCRAFLVIPIIDLLKIITECLEWREK